jgi:hypothetical protein
MHNRIHSVINKKDKKGAVWRRVEEAEEEWHIMMWNNKRVVFAEEDYAFQHQIK